MVSAAEARDLALSFTGVSQAPHHHMTSYRIGNKIIATVPDAEHWHVMASETEIRAAAAAHPACQEKWWGGRLAAVRVELAGIDATELRELLDDAYRSKVSAAARAGRGSSRPDPSPRRRSRPTG